MYRTSMIAALALSLAGLAACGEATSDRVPGRAGIDNGRVDGLTMGAPVDDAASDALMSGAAIGLAPRDAVTTPDGPNRIHIEKSLSQNK